MDVYDASKIGAPAILFDRNPEVGHIGRNAIQPSFIESTG
jgi:hypothetical protein